MTWLARAAIEEALRDLSDRDYQMRSWVDPTGEDVSSFEETVSSLFDDSGLGHALGRGRPVFSPEVDGRLIRLRALVAAIDTRRGPIEIVNDSKMEAVRVEARQALDSITAVELAAE